ncbi:WSCD family member AGAP003962 [Papilio xuthus]|uniref:WSCD family member AGAP003962 n=1 Tax=Papilio xuthus TaxID=66420 RepID=A0A194PIC8_PAPXU|nr:WSCD family member AGAP003962 [Papilio xuthus]
MLCINAKQVSNDKNTTDYLKVEWCKELHWRTPPLPFAIALASYPGSGNTWLRYLLQQVTGIVTGSVYMDYNLRKHGFPAENISDGSVLVVKTHQYAPSNLEQFESAVLLIRNPRDAILSTHLKNLVPIPLLVHSFESLCVALLLAMVNDTFWGVSGWAKIWRLRNSIESIVGTQALHRNQLSRFLHLRELDDMNCALSNKEGLYKRKKKYKDFDPFSLDMYRQIDIVRRRVYTKIIESTK